MYFKAGGREVETIATDTVTQCSKTGKISAIFQNKYVFKLLHNYLKRQKSTFFFKIISSLHAYHFWSRMD